jgi:hypothetical protein
MSLEKAGKVRTQRSGSRASSRRSLDRTKRGSKVGLILFMWIALLGWIGVSSYNVIRQPYSSVYARDRGPGDSNGLPDRTRSSGAVHEPAAAGAAVDFGAGLLLTSGLVVFFLATAVRLLMNKRREDDT